MNVTAFCPLYLAVNYDIFLFFSFTGALEGIFHHVVHANDQREKFVRMHENPNKSLFSN